MHPEIEDQVRIEARQYVTGVMSERNDYAMAAEEGRITFDDLYFIGLVNAAFHQGFTDRTDVAYMAGSFRKTPDVYIRSMALLSDMLKLPAEEIKRLYNDITRKVEGSDGESGEFTIIGEIFKP